MSRLGGGATRQGCLHEVVGSAKAYTSFILVGGVGMPSPEEWSNKKSNMWLQAIPPDIIPGYKVLSFDHGLSSPSDFSWQSLLDQGEELATGLLQEHEAEKCPIILIAHSTGGLIVKEALCLVIKWRSHQSRSLIEKIAAVIFLGTPHSTKEHDELWANVVFTIRSWTKTKKQGTINHDDTRLLADLSLRFEETANSIPVLSISERHKTKVRTRISSKDVFITPERFVRTNVQNEQFLAFETDHRGLCNVDPAWPAFKELYSFIETSLEDTRLRIVKGSSEGSEYQAPSILDSLSARSSSSSIASLSQGIMETTLSAGHNLKAKQTTHDSPDSEAEIASQFSSSRRDPQLPCYMTPLRRNRDFFNRTGDLKSLESIFFQPSASPSELKAVAVCGPGGIGKTQVVAEFVNIWRQKFDAIFWVYADTASKLADAFTSIAKKLALVSEGSVDSKDQVVTREIFKGWLANPVKSYSKFDNEVPDKASWLLVFDNADEPNILTDYWPLDGPGCVITTSRDPLGWESCIVVFLNPFSDNEASKFLEKLTKRTEDPEEKENSNLVAKKLGGLPLALAQMASIITRRDLSFAEFLQAYDEKEGRKELFPLREENPGHQSEYRHTLASVWPLKSLKHGRRVLDVISMLDPDGIPEFIFTSYPMTVALPGFPKIINAYQRARTELLQCSLVTRDRSDKSATKLVIHRLVQDAARELMEPFELRATFTACVRLISSVWPWVPFTWRHGVHRWPKCGLLAPHVVRLKESFKGIMETGLDDIYGDYEFAKLLTDVGWYYHERGKSVDSTGFYDQAESICEMIKLKLPHYSPLEPQKALSKAQIDPILAEIHHNRGCICTETNQPAAALKHHGIFNAMMVAELGDGPYGADMRLAISWNQYGNAKMINKLWRDGEDCFLKSISTMEGVEGFTKDLNSFAKVNLGLAYWLTDRPEDAENILVQGLEDRRDVLGPNDRHSFITGRFLHALGNVKATQGLLEEALKYHREALLHYKNTIGNNHHRTADTCVKVADHYTRLGQNGTALSLLNQALKVFSASDVYKPENARATFKRSRVLSSLKREEEAVAELRRSFSLYKEVVPDNTKALEDLGDSDFDEPIVFWSK